VSTGLLDDCQQAGVDGSFASVAELLRQTRTARCCRVDELRSATTSQTAAGLVCSLATGLTRINRTQRLRYALETMAASCADAVYYQGFIDNLTGHLLARLLGRDYDGDENSFTPKDLLQVSIVNNAIFAHKTVRFNYTTYESRRASDTVNPRTHPDVMLNSVDDNTHQYWYARVIGIYHADVVFRGGDARRMDFLHVRWLARDSSHNRPKRLPRVGFFDYQVDADLAFGFLDPAVVVRSAHLIPAFAFAQRTTLDLLGPRGSSIARRHNSRDPSEWTWDYSWFYVNMCVPDVLIFAMC
jgi:hypothetical protein